MNRWIVGLIAGFFLSTTAVAALEPQQRVAAMVDSVMSILQQDETPLEVKKARISGLVQENLNMRSMSRRTLGSYWNDATEEQRQRFAGLFVQVLEGTYLNRISDYSGGSVEYLKQRVKGNKAIVDTRFVSDTLQIPVQYLMILENGSWQVFDLVIEGVSLIRNYRSSYGEIIRKDGYDGLIALMEQKVAAMNPPSAPSAPHLQ